MPPQSYSVYILRCRDDTLYIGSTDDLSKRVHAHNHLKSGAKYTRGRRPVVVVYREQYETYTEARQREHALKKLSRREKLILIASHQA